MWGLRPWGGTTFDPVFDLGYKYRPSAHKYYMGDR